MNDQNDDDLLKINSNSSTNGEANCEEDAKIYQQIDLSRNYSSDKKTKSMSMSDIMIVGAIFVLVSYIGYLWLGNGNERQLQNNLLEFEDLLSLNMSTKNQNISADFNQQKQDITLNNLNISDSKENHVLTTTQDAELSKQLDQFKQINKAADDLKIKEQMLQNKIDNHRRRNFLFQMNQDIGDYTNLKYAKYNLLTDTLSQSQKQQMKKILQQQLSQAIKKYQIDTYNKQLSMCVFVGSYNNEKNYRYEYNLISILNQNYTNYRVIIYDDGSFDQTGKLIQQYLNQNKIGSDRVLLIINKQRKGPLSNLYEAVYNHCKQEDIVMLVSGDDELLGRQVFKVFNSVYQSKNAQVVYSNFIEFNQKWTSFKYGFGKKYSGLQKMTNTYRQIEQKFTHLKSFKARLFKKIDVDHLKRPSGQWYSVAWDFAVMFSLLQLSCGKIQFIPSRNYLYKTATGNNYVSYAGNSIITMSKSIRNLPRYICDVPYQETSEDLREFNEGIN